MLECFFYSRLLKYAYICTPRAELLEKIQKAAESTEFQFINESYCITDQPFISQTKLQAQGEALSLHKLEQPN